jgi:tetratricopeptide (TPR) repeat protein
VALKQILERHADDPLSRQRFLVEAEVTGGLEHPGVVPVYGLGTYGDGRPYYAMRFVRGESLKEAIERFHADQQLKRDPGRRSLELRKLLRRFVDVCNAVEYAHSRGILHRDLKPSNVIVGKHGETLVVDWGLAKPLGRVEPGRNSGERTLIPSSGSGSSSTLPGSALGTPVYMSPEQSEGDLEHLGPPSDVYSLGATIYCILTGRPPFDGDLADVIRSVQQGQFPPPRQLDPSIDRLLEAVVLKAMAQKPADRYVSPRALADDVERWMADEPIAAWREPAIRRARRWARRNKTLVTAAAVALVLVGASSVVVGSFIGRQRRLAEARAQRAEEVLAELRLFKVRAERAGDDKTAWEEVRGAARRVEPLLDDLPDPPARGRAAALLHDAFAGADAADRDRAIVDKLVDIRSAKSDDGDGSATDLAYAAAFRAAGIDPAAMTAEEVGDQIRARPPATAAAFAAVLDDWAAVRRDRRKDHPGAARLSAAARLADPNPWRNRLRDALDTADQAARRTALLALARSAETEALPAVNFDLLDNGLAEAGARAEAASVLRRGRRIHADDVWLNFDLARTLATLARREEAIRYYTAVRALRPDSAHELAHALKNRGESEEGIAVFRDLVRLRPADGRRLGDALQDRGLAVEARQLLTEAVAVLQRTIAARPDDLYAHVQLGNALSSLGRLEEALAMYPKAVSIEPGSSLALVSLGKVLESLKRYDEAVGTYRESLRFEPDDTSALLALGRTLSLMGSFDEGIATLRQAVRIAPDDGMCHNALGWALTNNVRPQEALPEAREGVRLMPDDPNALLNLGSCLLDLGRYDEAESALRESVKNRPDYPFALNYLAWLLSTAPERKMYDPQEALALARKAVEYDPLTDSYWNTLGVAFYRAGRWDEAIKTLGQSALRQQGKDSSDWFFVSMARWRRGEVEESSNDFIRAISSLRKYDLSEADCRRFWAEAIALFGGLSPGVTPSRINTDPERAMVELRRIIDVRGVDLARLRTDSGLAPLRVRPDFGLLLMDAAMPADPFAPWLPAP